jgi:hypothetical protein
MEKRPTDLKEKAVGRFLGDLPNQARNKILKIFCPLIEESHCKAFHRWVSSISG